MHFRRTGGFGADLQEPVNQAKRACDRDRKIAQHHKTYHGILAEKGIYTQSRWEEIWQVGSFSLNSNAASIQEHKQIIYACFRT